MSFFKYTTEFPFLHECPEAEAQFVSVTSEVPKSLKGSQFILDLRALLAYTEKDEKQHYDECTDPETRRLHIYHNIRRLRAALEKL